MNILLLGSGGREHALAWKLSQSPQCSKLFVAPGNPGTARHGTNLSFAVTDFEAIKAACVKEAVDMVIIGPEEPLVNGIVDFLKESEDLKDLLIIGPSAEAARLEGSKAYAKAFMRRHGIPTAAYREFTVDNYEEGTNYLRTHPLPVVLKADGLAAGKGVIIADRHEGALEAFEQMLQWAKFGEAGKKVVVEEFMSGIELSVFAITDGKDYVLLPEAKDYKRIGEGDTGLNTGGMGAISPVPFANEAFMQQVITKIVEPTINGLHQENLDYKGFVFFGLIKAGDEPYVIEYNCRMGDPETEVVLPRLQSDLLEILSAAAKGTLNNISIENDPQHAATIMAVSGGYPEDYQKGFPINGLTEGGDSLVFQAGTAQKDGIIVTGGGRVLCVTSLGHTLEEALEASRERLSKINFKGMYYRKDIGYEFGPAHPVASGGGAQA